MASYDSEPDPRSQIVHMKQIQAEGLELFIKKNADYGNSYKQYGLVGVLIRLQDKINRALNITANGIRVQSETLRDTLIDLHNYSAMAIMEIEPTVKYLPMAELTLPTVQRIPLDLSFNASLDPISQVTNQENVSVVQVDPSMNSS